MATDIKKTFLTAFRGVLQATITSCQLPIFCRLPLCCPFVCVGLFGTWVGCPYSFRQSRASCPDVQGENFRIRNKLLQEYVNAMEL